VQQRQELITITTVVAFGILEVAARCVKLEPLARNTNDKAITAAMTLDRPGAIFYCCAICMQFVCSIDELVRACCLVFIGCASKGNHVISKC
jgi:hypothetical protein